MYGVIVVCKWVDISNGLKGKGVCVWPHLAGLHGGVLSRRTTQVVRVWWVWGCHSGATVWIVTPCSLVEGCPHLGRGTASIIRSKSMRSKQLAYRPSKCRQYVPPKRRYTTRTHDVTSQKIVLFIISAVRNSDMKITRSIVICTGSIILRSQKGLIPDTRKPFTETL
jgi:hypothetical protein